MKVYRYEITRHSGEEFTKMVYACTEDGKCTLDQIPMDQVVMLEGILNDRGAEGWELIQVVFKKEGLIAFWKKETEGAEGG